MHMMEVEQMKRGKEKFEERMAIFKWRQAGMFARFIDELDA